MVDSQKRIAGAFIVGAFIVSSALVVRGWGTPTQIEAIAIIPNIERQHIDTKDDDGDGVPNWQDELQVGEAIVLGTSTEVYEPPTTVTGNVAVNFFKKYLNSKAYGMFGNSKEELIESTAQELVQNAKGEQFLLSDLHIEKQGETLSLRVYGNQIADILLSHPTTGENELAIFSDALAYKQPEKLRELTPIIQAYGEMTSGIIALAVPKAYSEEHLNLANALNAVRDDIRAMQNVDNDALYTFARMKRYHDDVLGLQNATLALYNKLYLIDKVRWDDGESTLRVMTFQQ